MSSTAQLQGMPAAHAHHAEYGWSHALQSLLWVTIAAVFITSFVLQPFRIPSESMEPTLKVGDFLMVMKLGPDAKPSLLDPLAPTGIRRGDVVIFHYPLDPSLHLVKRVAGVPGDHVKLHEGHLWVNDKPLPEPFAAFHPAPAGQTVATDAYRDDFPHLSRPDPETDAAWWMRMHTLVRDGELTVPPGEFFVLGDNRDKSDDSRYWGLVPRGAIVGRPLVVYLSVKTPDDGNPATANSLHALEHVELDRTLHLVR